MNAVMERMSNTDGKRYIQIAEQLFAEVREGKYSACHSFPSLTKIMRRFSVARATAVKSVDELKKRGVLKSFPRSRLDVVGRNRLIGVVLPGIAYTDFFSSVLIGISRQCQKEGYGLLFADAYSREHEVRVRQAKTFALDFVLKRVSGVIFQPIELVNDAERINSEIISTFLNAGIHVTLIDNDVVFPPERSMFDLVGVNNFDAGRRVAEHLLRAGAKRIHFFVRGFGTISVQNRIEGVKSAIYNAGGKCPQVLRVFAENDKEECARFLKKFKPDAMIGGNDSDAVYLKHLLDCLGVSVPDDIMLAGFDDAREAVVMTPQLTTVRQPGEDIGVMAVRVLRERIVESTLPPREILLPAPLIVRRSTCVMGKGKSRCLKKSGKERV